MKAVWSTFAACAFASFVAAMPANASVLLPAFGAVTDTDWHATELVKSFLPFYVSVVPESAVWVMMLVGFGFIGWSLRNAPIIDPPE
jgi:hypothetical protein